jgi:aryl-alcohol dehydrogenase
MKIQAAVAYAETDKFDLIEVELEDPREDEILVKIAGVGLCHTDLLFRSLGEDAYPFPAVFGHEGSGVVQRVGSKVTKVIPGDRVAITFRSCGICDRCIQGSAPYCRTMPMLNYTGMRPDGSKAIHGESGEISSHFFGQSSFATHALTTERNVVKVPDDVALDLMGPLGCGIQTGVGGIVNSLDAEAGSTVLIVGGGSVGLSAVMGAKIRKCKTIILTEPMENRRELAIELGATHTIDPSETTTLEEAVRRIVPQGVDYAFDTAGIPSVLEDTIGCLGSKGVLGIVGIAPPDTRTPGLLQQIVTYGLTIKGIIEGDSNPDEFIPELIAHYKAGRLPFDKMVKTYKLSEINQAVADQLSGKCVKAVLIPG